MLVVDPPAKPKERACPLCGGTATAADHFYRDPDDTFKTPLLVSECRSCGLAYLRSQVNLNPLYFGTYYGKTSGLPALIFEPFNRFWVDRKARSLAKVLSGNRILDFGCGRGDFLDAMKRLGWETWGVESQKDMVAAMRSTGGHHVAADLEDLQIPPESLDGITMWHVLEHLDHPAETVARLAQLSKPGGKLFVAVPNWDSWERHFFGDRWFHLDVPRHQLHFSSVRLIQLLEDSGWEVQSVRYDAWAYNVFGLFQALLNLGPGPRNLFYRVCKRGLSFRQQPASFWVGVTWNLAAFLPAVLVSLVLVGPLTVLKVSGTCEILAVKRTSETEDLTPADRAGALRRIFQVIAIRAKLIASVLAANLRLTQALPAEWRRRYERARLDFAANDPIFHPSKQWTIITRFYRLLLRGRGVDGFKSTFGRFLSSYDPTNPRIFQATHHLYRQVLEPRDVWNLLDSIEEPELGKGNWIDYRGRRVTLDLLQSIDELYRLKECLNFGREDRVVFCELGAGYGRLADVVLRAMPNAVYMIFDLPESLLLSQHYLTKLHPEAPAALYPESSEALASAEAIRSHRLMFGLPHQLRLVPSGVLDAFINIYSMMEMGRGQIAAYFDAIERLQPRALFLKQHKREANIYDRSLNTESNYPVRPAWRNGPRGTSALFEHVFESTWLIR